MRNEITSCNGCFLSLQKQSKFDEAKSKLLKARNEYLLSLNSANAALHKYFAEDLPELMDVSQSVCKR